MPRLRVRERALARRDSFRRLSRLLFLQRGFRVRACRRRAASHVFQIAERLDE